MFGKAANKEIREMMKGLKGYEVAFTLGLDPSTFSRWLTIPMTDERRNRTIQAIKELRKQNERRAV